MSDGRPRPEYGEYATPEEVAAITGRPVVPPVEPAAEPPVSPAGPVAAYPPPSVAQPAASAVPPSGAAARRAAPVWDRALTIGLLLLGLFHLLLATVGYLRFDEGLKLQFGIDELADPGAVQAVGVLALVTHIVALAGCAWWALRRLAAGRIAFWVPLIGATATAVIPGVVLATVLVRDPAFTALFTAV